MRLEKKKYKFNDDVKKMVEPMRPALKKLRSIDYDHLNKIDNDIWDRLVAKPRDTYFASGDSLTFIIKWCELLSDQIAYISSCDLQQILNISYFMINCHKNKL